MSAEEEERKIPVFTVLKNGAILKNIFVINNSPDPNKSIAAVDLQNEENPDEEMEEILIVGRHPECNIVLMHPSISRFHLQINSRPFSQKLFVTDLSSVHGTWVSERKLEPGFRMELKEGDTIKVGVSTRVYRLHWAPLSYAYSVENPLVSAIDVEMLQEKEEEHQVLEGGNESGIYPTCIERDSLSKEEEHQVLEGGNESVIYPEKLNITSDENGEIRYLDMSLEEVDTLFSDENWGPVVDKQMLSEPLVPEDRDVSSNAEKEEIESLPSIDHKVRKTLSLQTVEVCLDPVIQQLNEHNHNGEESHSVRDAAYKTENTEILMACSGQENDFAMCPELKSVEDDEENAANEMSGESKAKILFLEGHEDVNNFPHGINFKDLYVSVDTLTETNSQQVDRDSQTSEPYNTMQPLHEEGNQENLAKDKELNVLVRLHTSCSNDVGTTEIYEVKNIGLSEKNYGLGEPGPVYSIGLGMESVNSSLPDGNVASDIMDNKENQTPQSIYCADGNLEIKSDKNSRNIWSRRGRPSSVLQLKTSRSRAKSSGPDTDAEAGYEEYAENRSIKKSLFSSSEKMEEEIYAPDKENYNPNTLLLKSLKKKTKIEEMQSPELKNSSLYRNLLSTNIHSEDDELISSDKENQTTKILHQGKLEKATSKNQVILGPKLVLEEKRAERLPLQSLHANSSGMSEVSVPKSATESKHSISFPEVMQTIRSCGKRNRRWTMVVDTTTLLDKESRKSLQLLQGLKGTHLIIPRMVIGELECLRQRGGLFGRKTEASLVLEWIEQCLANAEWWIHVQSTMDEAWRIAPTPPASPHSDFTFSVPFSAKGSPLEFASPTSEDHIIDFALFSRIVCGDGQLVLLSNDVALKIKAMAEGLICETAQEFRNSLVNPFSERFLWADSSPRGLTWSVSDDLVLKEKYYRSPSKKSTKAEGAKGLKLILLHNSHYGQIS